MYTERVQEPEIRSFIIVKFTTLAEIGPLSSALVRRLSEKISESHSEALSLVAKHISTRHRFSLQENALVALHNVINKYMHTITISFNQNPLLDRFEVPEFF